MGDIETAERTTDKYQLESNESEQTRLYIQSQCSHFECNRFKYSPFILPFASDFLRDVYLLFVAQFILRRTKRDRE